ncbi:nitrophenyl compound nitroreductase subunit ArsF family protein [Ferrimonas lipolytica]|uniref:Thioredoxin domain-containing protein n=1 Tax=Ferrimonas lipolytica TaxID=2724191 RepID=A0A6H1UEQ2_9GAMM|nr:nitrophenyl compound nitroreductase subunit ArsF family protein [Ferrimonas lipolytica]QIZ77561.1 hypothetical protein HER31_12060 [Ferrimonas lipolytica]
MSIKSTLLMIMTPLVLLVGLMSMGSNANPKNIDINYQPTPIELTNNQQLNVYYFHGNARCATCKRIEKYTVEALQQGYGVQVGKGAIELKIVNLEEAENEHFIDDFELVTRSVVLELELNGQPQQWRRLDRVWELVTAEQSFIDYIYAEMAVITANVANG